MRLSFKLLGLFAVTSVFAFDIGLSTFDISNKNKTCMNDIEKFSTQCLIKEEINTSNIEKACTKFNNEDCQKQFQAGVKGFDQCDSLFGFEKFMNAYYVAMKFFCEKDEEGKMCPLAAAAITEDNGSLKSGDEELIPTVKETCNSKKCKEVTKVFLEDSPKSITELIGYFVDKVDGIGKDDPELRNVTNTSFEGFYENIIKSIDRGDCVVSKEEITASNEIKSSKVNFAFIVFIGLFFILF